MNVAFIYWALFLKLYANGRNIKAMLHGTIRKDDFERITA